MASTDRDYLEQLRQELRERRDVPAAEAPLVQEGSSQELAGMRDEIYVPPSAAAPAARAASGTSSTEQVLPYGSDQRELQQIREEIGYSPRADPFETAIRPRKERAPHPRREQEPAAEPAAASPPFQVPPLPPPPPLPQPPPLPRLPPILPIVPPGIIKNKEYNNLEGILSGYISQSIIKEEIISKYIIYEEKNISDIIYFDRKKFKK